MVAGGKKTLMEFARLAPEIAPEYAAVIEDYESLNAKGKKTVSIDFLCKVRKLDPFHFLGVIAEAAVKYRDNASVIIAAVSLPKVIEASVKSALKVKTGFKDRKLLAEHAAFVPVPSGGTFVNNLMTRVDTNVGEAPASGHLPSFEKTIEAIDVEDE